MNTEILRSNPTLSKLHDKDIEWLAKTGKTETIKSQDVIIKEGQIVKNIYIVLEGQLCLSIPNSNGPDQEVATVNMGEIVGEMSLIDKQPSHINSTALEKSEILTISHQQLTAKCQIDQGFAARFYHTIALLASNRLKGISDLLAKSKVVPGPALRKVLLVFGELEGSDIEWISNIGKGERVSNNTVLLQQGEPAKALYILLEGTVSVSILIGKEGEKFNKEIAKMSTGEIVGEMSFLDGSMPSATVKAADNCFVLALPRESLAQKMQSDLGFARRFYQSFALVLVNRLTDRLVQRGFGKINEAQNEIWDEDTEFEDELDLDLLKSVSLAATRFDWLVKKMK